MAKKNQLVLRRGTGAVAALAPVGVRALEVLLNDKGSAWVAQQLASGLLKLSRGAAAWWSSGRTTQVVAPVVTQAPASQAITIGGSAKFQGSIRVKHRELITSADLSIGYDFRINPFDSTTFPYLSTLARMYDKYRFHSLQFVVVSSVSTSQGGRYYMSWDPDSEDSPPVSSADFMAMRHSVSTSSWQSVALSVENQKEPKFVRPLVDSQQDHGRMSVNASAVNTIVDLYVEYDVSLIDPSLSSGTTLITNISFFTTGVVTRYSGPEVVTQPSLPQAGTFVLAPGRYLVNFTAVGLGITAAASSYTPLDGAPVTAAERNTTSSTQLNDTMVISCAGRVFVDLNDTWTALTRATLTVSSLSIPQYNSLVASL